MNYFNELKLQNNNILTCDKLRLKFSITTKSLKLLNHDIEKLSISDSKYFYQYYHSTNYFTYRENLIFKFGDSVVALGLLFNGCNNEENSHCYIEFNPNKSLSNHYAEPIVDLIRKYSTHLELARFDLAIDIPVDRNFVFLKKDRRNYTQTYKIISSGANLNHSTEYLGQRDNNGFVKVYNKTIESNLDYDVTRVEITLDSFDYINFIKYLPCVYYLTNPNLLAVSKLSQSDKTFFNLLLGTDNPLFYVNCLGRDKKQLFIQYLFDRVELGVSEVDFYHLCCRVRSIFE